MKSERETSVEGGYRKHVSIVRYGSDEEHKRGSHCCRGQWTKMIGGVYYF